MCAWPFDGLTATQLGGGNPASCHATAAWGWSMSKTSHQVNTGKLIWMRGFRNADCKRLITTASPFPRVQYGACGSRFGLKSSSCSACIYTQIVDTICLMLSLSINLAGDDFEAVQSIKSQKAQVLTHLGFRHFGNTNIIFASLPTNQSRLSATPAPLAHLPQLL